MVLSLPPAAPGVAATADSAGAGGGGESPGAGGLAGTDMDADGGQWKTIVNGKEIEICVVELWGGFVKLVHSFNTRA